LTRARTGFPRQHEMVKADLAGKLVKMPMCAHSLNFVSTQSECRVETCPSAGDVQRLRVCLANDSACSARAAPPESHPLVRCTAICRGGCGAVHQQLQSQKPPSQAYCALKSSHCAGCVSAPPWMQQACSRAVAHLHTHLCGSCSRGPQVNSAVRELLSCLVHLLRAECCTTAPLARALGFAASDAALGFAASDAFGSFVRGPRAEFA
jgi:hypothetical protein